MTLFLYDLKKIAVKHSNCIAVKTQKLAKTQLFAGNVKTKHAKTCHTTHHCITQKMYKKALSTNEKTATIIVVLFYEKLNRHEGCRLAALKFKTSVQRHVFTPII